MDEEDRLVLERARRALAYVGQTTIEPAKLVGLCKPIPRRIDARRRTKVCRVFTGGTPTLQA